MNETHSPRRRTLVGAVASSVLVPGVARGQPRRLPRIGLLIAETLAGQAQRRDALLAGLRDFGYVEGTTLAIEARTADGNYDELAGLAAGLVRVPVDLIVAFGIKALVAAREATATLPIVIPSTSSDPVAMGLVPRLARQGSNITGSLAVGPEIMAKRVELLREIQPSLTRIAVLVNPANASFEPMLARMRRSSNALGVALSVQRVERPDALPSSLSGLARNGTRAFVLQDDTLFAVQGRVIADLARSHKLASAGGAAYADAGGLLGYGASDLALYRRAAYFIDRILKGTPPGQLPMEQATRFELVANARTARALGLALPGPLLLRSDRVVE